MALSSIVSAGRRGWITVGAITLTMGALVGSSAHASVAHADRRPVTVGGHLSPSVTGRSAVGTPSVTTLDAPAAPAHVRSARRTPKLAPAASGHLVAPAHVAAARPADACSGPDWQVRRGEQELATLVDSGQRSGVTVSFLGARAGYLGLTYPAAHHVDVFVRPCASESDALLRHVISHEMGHAYDAAHMSDALRSAYKAMRGIPASTPWFGCSYCTDFDTPAGDFAETYSQWQRGAGDSRTQIAAIPGPAALAAIASAFFGA